MPYIDSRGAEMADMNFSEALELMHDLATSNLPDENDIAEDPMLVSDRQWQKVALNTLEDTITNHCDAIDDEFTPPEACAEWPQDVLQADRNDDPSDPLTAIRIALAMARNALPDASAVTGVVEAETFDTNAQALDLVEDFIGLHGEEFRNKITVVPTPRF